ncbi:MAG: N-6 DNA methylase [Synergistaceae bacterium]|nr:N-6 DNA methylase [Synergistaceae bacterium]
MGLQAIYSTLFIDASNECVKATNSNKLTAGNIDKILTTYIERMDKEYFAKLVPNSDVAAQDYNLSVTTYVEQEDRRETVNITALNAEIERIVAREDVLRHEINAIVAEIEQGTGPLWQKLTN